MKSFIIILLLCVFGGSKLFAQKTEFIASAPSVVEVGEQFRLSFVLNAKGENLQVPTIKGFDLLAGPSLSTSSNITIINGDMKQSQEINNKLYAINKVLFCESNPIPIKAAMYISGLIPSLEYRLPLLAPSKENIIKIEQVLQDYEVLP